ncbi:Di-copper centre-containing protein [Lindgomyces ingoldianus]|uniref:Di-copper centre-containing protein n=1 Tax=Lindgomyces ingoldianus TaxID=673940 RepID=A0ACB6RIZ1_9PLEO|nr:Di-copper centre-containing protein [Lindgomyces ingoldianus]KAF2478297.1 Di-copper centre-containing protein [Lindgomyces ingoldianus]
MRHSFLLALLGAAPDLVSAAALPSPSLAPALPLSAFNFTIVKPLTLEEAQSGGKHSPEVHSALVAAAAATCTNPRVRTEWDSYSTSDRTAFVNALKCLLGKPASGQFSQARNRYEDLVSLHQTLTPNVHGNSKFLIWHRYFVWTFEDILRTECGFDRNLPWFDETRYPGKFSQSSVFSNEWFGAIGIGGNCVTNGQFAGLTLNVGPGPGNGAHCLSRNGDASKTANCNQAMVDACNSRSDYADMASCAEGGVHAWGHNGIGAVMSDVYASPGDPVFWLHHAFVDRNYRIWQNADAARVGYIDGTDRVGNPLTLDTVVSVNGMRPNVQIRDIINTMGDKLCYKYNY